MPRPEERKGHTSAVTDDILHYMRRLSLPTHSHIDCISISTKAIFLLMLLVFSKASEGIPPLVSLRHVLSDSCRVLE